MTDPRPMFGLALDQTQRMIDTVQDADLDLATPCPEYDVRALLGHLVSAVGRINLALTGEDPLQIPTVTTDVADFSGSWKQRRAAVDEAVKDPSTLERTYPSPWGPLPGAVVIAAYTGELTAHAWDIAKATGQIALLDSSLAEYCLPVAQKLVPAEPRGEAFGPVVEVAADASAYDRFVGWIGRTP